MANLSAIQEMVTEILTKHAKHVDVDMITSILSEGGHRAAIASPWAA